MQVKDVLTRRVKRISPETPLREVATRMRDLDVGVLPVFDKDRLVGMVTDRDVAVRAVADGRDPTTATVREIMSSEIFYCFEDQEIEEAARLMKEKQVRRLVVLNREKRLAGIVSLGDLAVSGSDRLAAETLQSIARVTAS